MPPAISPVIRELRPDDLPDALALSTSAGWNQQLEDWRMLHVLATPAAFAAVAGSRVVGTALAIDYGEFAWIAMMLVAPEFRARGIGARLLEAALNAVPPGRAVRLDATPAGRALYRRYEFEDEARLTRFVRPEGRARAPIAHDQPMTRQMVTTDLELIARHDVASFGGTRAGVLAWALERTPHLARMVDAGDGPPQYTLGRPGRVFSQIGPVVAADERSARGLVAAALAAAAGRSAAIDAFDAEAGFIDWLGSCGFAGERPLYRMRRSPAAVAPPDGARTRSTRQFAIFGPDFA